MRWANIIYLILFLLASHKIRLNRRLNGEQPSASFSIQNSSKFMSTSNLIWKFFSLFTENVNASQWEEGRNNCVIVITSEFAENVVKSWCKMVKKFVKFKVKE